MIGQAWELGHNNQRKISAGDVVLIDHSGKVMNALSKNLMTAAQAAGVEAVGMIKEKMESGYHDVHPIKPVNGSYPHTSIRDTSALIQNVQFDAEPTADGVDVMVGNTLDYAMFVHEGTRYLQKRPYITDAVTEGMDRLQKIMEAGISSGFK